MGRGGDRRHGLDRRRPRPRRPDLPRGGLGHLIGDEGSAYAVVLAALRRVARRADGREPRPFDPDPLTARLLEAVGVGTLPELVPAVYAPGVDRTRIAGLAPEILAAIKDDPAIVPDLLEPAGLDLAETVMAAARALGWRGGPLPLALAGGFLLASPDLTGSLLDHLRRAGYAPEAKPVADPVAGALVLAREAYREPSIS